MPMDGQKRISLGAMSKEVEKSYEKALQLL